MQLPTYAQIEPVGQCNLRCTMCSIQFRKDGPPHGPPAFMQWDTFTRLVDEFTTLESLHLQGLGEPMMHPRFFDMVQYAVERGVKVTTNTNMTLLNETRAERCVTSGLSVMFISVDGATAETYENIRHRSRLEKVLRNIEMLREAKARLASETPHMQLVMVIMRQNLAELPDLVREAKSWGMERISAQHLAHDFGESTLPARYIPMRDYVEEQTLLNEDPARIERSFNAAREVAAEVGIELRLPRTRPRQYPEGTPGRERCDWPWSGAYISYEGHAMPCCMIATPDRYTMGNVSGGGFVEVWNNEDYEAFRAQLDSDDPPEVCQSCSLYHGTF